MGFCHGTDKCLWVVGVTNKFIEHVTGMTYEELSERGADSVSSGGSEPSCVGWDVATADEAEC